MRAGTDGRAQVADAQLSACRPAPARRRRLPLRRGRRLV